MKLLDFYEFIYDRQEIWHRRFVQKLPSPWATDKYLQNYKFCNVYRELDACTQHLLDCTIKQPLDIETKIFNIILFRFFNVRDFFDMTQGNYTPIGFKASRVTKHFDAIAKKRKLYNLAYHVAGNMDGKSKHAAIFNIMQRISMPGLCRGLLSCKSLKECHELLQEIPMVGPFLAYQILIDITYIKGFLKHDINSFVFVGPGATPAIDILFPKHDKAWQGLCKYCWEMQLNYFIELMDKTGKDWMKIYYKDAYYKSPYLSINNIQQALCEFRKRYNLEHKPNARKRFYKPKKEALNGAS